MSQRALNLAGATGLVGRGVLKCPLADPRLSALHSLGRRAPATRHAKLPGHIVDLAALAPLPRAEEMGLLIGLPIKVAGSQTASRALDYDTNLAAAKVEFGASVSGAGPESAIGADASPRVFYNYVDGLLEDAL